MFRVLWVFLVIVLMVVRQANGQAVQPPPVKPGKVAYQYDHRLDTLIEKHVRINETKNSIPGYRVQIYFGGQRTKANETKSEFLKKYPETSAYLIYQQPNFKIRVGDFRDRLQAYEFYMKLIADFKTAFIVKDEITLPELK